MAADEVLLNAVFYALALLAAGCAVGVAASRNIVRTAFALLGVLAGVAGLYLVAWADFLFAVQVLIYIGGILVLLVFAVMLTHRITNVRLSNESSGGFVPFVGVGFLFVALCLLILGGPWRGYEDYKRAQRMAAASGGEGPPVAGAFAVEPAVLEIVQMAGVDPAGAGFEVRRTGGEGDALRVTSSDVWLRATADKATLAPDETARVAVDVAAERLSPGEHSGRITVEMGRVGAENRFQALERKLVVVTLRLVAPGARPGLWVGSDSVEFAAVAGGRGAEAKRLRVMRVGPAGERAAVRFETTAPWVRVFPAEMMLGAGLPAEVRVTVDVEEMAPGSYDAQVRASMDGAAPSAPVAVRLVVARPPIVAPKPPGEKPLTRRIGEKLKTAYLLPFQAVGVLLLVAIVGASFLARKEVK